MYVRRLQRYVAAPLVYVAVLFGLLFLQFSGTLQVRRTVADIRFSGTLVPGDDETSQAITAARIEYAGLIFEFSDSRPLIVDTADGADAELFPQSFDTGDRSVTVNFSDGSLVRFEVLETGIPELHVTPEGTDAWPRTARLILPYRLADDVVAADADPMAPDVRIVTVGDRDYFLSAPPETLFQPELSRLAIPLGSGSQLLRYAELSLLRTDIIDLAFSNGQRQVSDQLYQQVISQYVDIGYAGWAGPRFNGGSGTWQMRDGAARFEEQILVAYLAEAWRRNEYTAAFNQMRRASDLHTEEIGIASSVYLGNLRAVTRTAISDDQQRTLSLLGRVNAGDASVFRDEEIVTFAALRGSPTLYSSLLDLARSVDIRVVDLATAVGLLAASVDQRHPSPEATTVLRRFDAIAEERILPAVRQFDNQFFIETAPGESDIYLSARAGDLLDQLGRRSGNQLLTTVGRNLVVSALNLADGQGFLPSQLLFDATGVTGQAGSIGPERLYPHLADNPAWPRMIPLYEQLGHGAYIYAVANFSLVDIRDDQHLYRLQYPRNRTHYVIMQGIEPFESMVLFRLQWRNDPSFEQYIKGRHYEPATETLMIKYTDDSVEGDIILNF